MENFILNNKNSKISCAISINVFKDIIEFLPETIDGIKVNLSKTNIEIIDNSKINVFLEIKIKNKLSIFDVIKNIKNKIEEHFILLIDSKPNNIVINCIV